MDFIITVYVITIFSSIVIAFLLVRLSRSTGQPKTGAKRPMKEERFTPSDTFAHGSLKESIFEEIKEEVFPKERCEEVSEDLSDIFTREFKKHTDLTKQEFDKKHKSLIEDVEVSWKKYKKVLTDQKETEAVVRGVAEGLVVLDSGGKVIMMNSAAEGLLGISKKDIIGKPILESLKTELLISLVKSSSDKGAKEIEIVSQNDETKRVLRSSNAVLEDENGKTVGIISILNDITKQKNLDQMKSNFVSTVTHELRTPLIATQKAISMLIDKETEKEVTPEMQKQFLSIADRNLKRLGVLIDDLLDLSKLEAGKMTLKREPAAIEEIVDESIGNLDAWARAKSIKIEKRAQQNIPKVKMDSNRIIQVLNNLIGNAIKFTPQNGTIIIETGLEKGGKEIRISVEDTGIGIEKENLPRVFDKFYHTTERISTDISGTGLGLSIAKEIVELHGGRIWVESEKDSGARFAFTLKPA